MRGQLDRVGADIVEGWAYDPLNPGRPVPLELLDNGVVIARFTADQYRADLENAGLGNGYCAFFPRIGGGWSPWRRHVVQVRRAGDHAELHGSPIVLEPPVDGLAVLNALVREIVRSTSEQGTPERAAALQSLVARAIPLLADRAASGTIGALADLAAFHARWSAVFPDALPPMPVPARRPPGQPNATRRRALVITGALPDLADARIRDCIKSLARLGHVVEIVTFSDDRTRDSDDLRASLEAEGFACSLPWLGSVEESLRRRSGLLDLVLFNRAAAALNYGALARRHMPNARLILFLDSNVPVQHLHARAGPRTQDAVATWLVDSVFAQSADQAEALRVTVPSRSIQILAGGDTQSIDAAVRNAMSERSR